ncbi:unnamed protein product, partial [Prunus brigantina]
DRAAVLFLPQPGPAASRRDFTGKMKGKAGFRSKLRRLRSPSSSRHFWRLRYGNSSFLHDLADGWFRDRDSGHFRSVFGVLPGSYRIRRIVKRSRGYSENANPRFRVLVTVRSCDRERSDCPIWTKLAGRVS